MRERKRVGRQDPPPTGDGFVAVEGRPQRNRLFRGVQAVVGLLLLCASGVALIWVAKLAQLAGDTTEPQLVEARVYIAGLPSAALWALGVWAVVAAMPRRSIWFVAVVFLAVAPWVVLVGSVVDVLREVCARPGGRCG